MSRLESGTRLFTVPLCWWSSRLSRRFAVDSSMSIALVAAREAARTDFTAVRFLTGVSAHVCRQVIAPAERAATDRARERPLAAVHASVPRQLVATRETSATVLHRTREAPRRRPCTDWRRAIATAGSSRCCRHWRRRFLFRFLRGRRDAAGADVGQETL